ncbi:tyrosine-type recombinase/integrase [Streptomyces sp. MB09-01]|nr:tyrosine-type recombinase/integrase [Streptomyces sp. MB09-01]
MVVTWLTDGGFRIGELCGLRLVDLHLREQATCGQCRGPHVHIWHREGNANRARVKTKAPWTSRDGTVCGGPVRRASPAMIHTYFEYITTQYPDHSDHGTFLVGLHGRSPGRPWTTAAARGMLRRAAARAEIGRVVPHAFRHSFATAVLDVAQGNALIARDAGGWASACRAGLRPRGRPRPGLHRGAGTGVGDTVMIPLTLLPGRTDRTRVGRDRLELLTALIDAPAFDPLFRDTLIFIPPHHPVYAWQCAVDDCKRIRRQPQPVQHAQPGVGAGRADGADQASLHGTATALPAARGVDYGRCLLCPAVSPTTRLCQQHQTRWQYGEAAGMETSSSTGPVHSTRFPDTACARRAARSWLPAPHWGCACSI